MNSKLYVGNLPYTTSENELRNLFEQAGRVASVYLPTDRQSGQPRGFGFVEMPNLKEAQAAIQALNGKEFMSRNLTVNPARPREERPRDFGGRSYDTKRRPGGKGNRSRRGF